MAELADEPTTLMFHAEKEPHEEPLSPTGPVDDYFGLVGQFSHGLLDVFRIDSGEFINLEGG
jgi:hypothetical protein